MQVVTGAGTENFMFDYGSLPHFVESMYRPPAGSFASASRRTPSKHIPLVSRLVDSAFNK